jgi:SAM-dependent methyltransferase
VGSPDPSQFYTGLVAELYSPLRSVVPEPEPYARFVEASGEPALELGCGTGDPLLDLRARGLDVEGLDSSADMLARCRAHARERGIDVVLHEQTIQSMDLPRRYRSMFLAGPTFNLLPDDATARRALERIRVHLEPGGSALIPLMVPSPTPPEDLGRAREHITADGRHLRVAIMREVRDERARDQTAWLRYEKDTGSTTLAEDRPWLLHWHTQAGFRELALASGLVVHRILTADGSAAGPDDPVFVFWLGVEPA